MNKDRKMKVQALSSSNLELTYEFFYSRNAVFKKKDENSSRRGGQTKTGSKIDSDGIRFLWFRSLSIVN